MRFEVWQSEYDGRWYWHIQAGNQQLMPDGGEGYQSRRNALRAARRIYDAIASGEVVRP